MAENEKEICPWKMLLADLQQIDDQEVSRPEEMDENLLALYLDDACTPEERATVEQLAASDPQFYEYIQAAREALSDLPHLAKPRTPRWLSRKSIPNWLIAASILIMIGVGAVITDQLRYLSSQVAKSENRPPDPQIAMVEEQVQSLVHALKDQESKLEQQQEKDWVLYKTYKPFFEKHPHFAALPQPNQQMDVRGHGEMTYVHPPVYKMVPEVCLDKNGNNVVVMKTVIETTYREERIKLPDSPIDRPPAPSQGELTRGLKHPNDITRWASAELLNKMGNPPAPALQNSIREALVARPTFTPEIVPNLLSHGDPLVRWATIYWFQQAGAGHAISRYPQAKSAIFRKVRDRQETPLVRKMAVYVVGEMGPDAEPVFRELLEIFSNPNADPQLRRWAAFAISRTANDGQKARPGLTSVLCELPESDRNDFEIVFPAVALALSTLERDKLTAEDLACAQKFLRKYIDDPNKNVKHWACVALAKLDKNFHYEQVLPTSNATTTTTYKVPENTTDRDLHLVPFVPRSANDPYTPGRATSESTHREPAKDKSPRDVTPAK